MAEVQRRLEARFPELDPAVVAAAIRVAAAGITGPVRDYVPLLVERAARERLDHTVAGGGTAPVEQGRPEPDPAVSPG
ncbi:MAG: three-helix bundle dimerization domain-containing protein [Ornithinibacter sp.]